MILAIASITTVAGCCCTMKYDGMDLSLKFEWLNNGGVEHDEYGGVLIIRCGGINEHEAMTRTKRYQRTQIV